MAATRTDIKDWLEQGLKDGATHVIIVCDTFDHDDYPVYVQPGEDVREKAEEYRNKDMQKVVEVYSLTLTTPIEEQLAGLREFHYD